MQTRRDFLFNAARLSAVASLGSLTRLCFADGDNGPQGRGTLICIFLRGGCDSLNMVVPYYDPTYYEVRPTIAIPATGENGVVQLNELFGLHPAMSSLYPFYEAGTFAPLIGIGSPHGSRSHFDCQDFMEYAVPGGRGVSAGWLNRYLTASKQPGESDFRAVALQGLLPRALRGRYPVLAVPELDRHNDPLDIFDDVYNDMEAETMERGVAQDLILESGKNAIKATRRYQEMTTNVPADEGAYPDNHFARRLRQIARIIKADAGLEAACIDYGGWDLHIQEGGSTGKQADLLRRLTESIAAFANDLGESRMEKVMVLTMSEFGRTVKENGNRGTDHGHGCCMLALGGQVKGGTIHGSWGGLEKQNLYDRRDLPVYTDFRLVMHEVLEKLYGCEVPADFFPKYRVPVDERLDFMRPA